MPVLSSTPSQPSSIAKLTSLAVPTPASTMTGYPGSFSFRYSRQMRMLFGIEHALSAADGTSRGHHRRRAGLFEPAGRHRIVGRVAQDLEPLLHELFGRLERGDGSGSSVFLSPRTSSFTQSAPGFSRPCRISRPRPRNADRVVGREAAGRVGQDRVPRQIEKIEDAASLRHRSAARAGRRP